ncbi:MAG: M28 family peptidase [Anaerolineales bacterium]|nr:M28 family peptidase [Anaerolineales bacterium]
MAESNDPLSAAELLRHVAALADDIGPRPAGHAAEQQARQYIHGVLTRLGIQQIEEMPLRAFDTWGYSLFAPLAISLMGNALGCSSRKGKLLGGLLGLASAYALWRTTSAYRQPLERLYPSRTTANLVARLPARGQPRQTIVLVGHMDSNKHRPAFAPEAKHSLRTKVTLGALLPLVNGLAQIWGAAGGGRPASIAQTLSLIGIAAQIPQIIHEEREGYIDGANDNASAAACLLGLAAYLHQNPIENTEIWLAFTAAEEPGCLGMHRLLDVYGDRLRLAWFIDFEMVGTEQIAYVTRHTSLSLLGAYRPDAESLALAILTAEENPHLGVIGREMVITEEVGSLRRRGFRGLCLAGVGPDGWLANWHQYSDTTKNIIPAGLERAARFALAMIEKINKKGSA